MYANMFRCFINVVMVGLSPRASIALPPNLHLLNDSTCLSAIHKHKLTLYFSLLSSSICILNMPNMRHGSWFFYVMGGIGYRLSNPKYNNFQFARRINSTTKATRWCPITVPTIQITLSGGTEKHH